MISTIKLKMFSSTSSSILIEPQSEYANNVSPLTKFRKDSLSGIKKGISPMQGFSKEFLANIGSIAVNSTLLEYSLIRTISNLMSSNSNKSLLMRLLFASDSLTPLSLKYKDVTIYLLRQNDLYKDELKKESEELFAELRSLIELRNTVIHSFWAIEENGQISRAKYKRHLSKDANILEDKAVNLDSIKSLPNDILALIKKISTFNKKVLTLIIE